VRWLRRLTKARVWTTSDSVTCRTLGELSNEVKGFIAEYVQSVIRLEVLLLLSEGRDKAWSAETVDRKLNLSANSARPHLDELLARGLLTLDGERYRYSPASDRLDKTVAQLSNAYATQRVAVLTLIFAKPVDKIRLFTETFRMIKGEGESNT
jgi:hypothetical protein